MAEQPSFLRLPYHIRRKIYCKLGLKYEIWISLSDKRLAGEWSAREQRLFRTDESYYEPFPNQLFYVSRAISEDARAVFYSENELRFSDDTDCELRSLLNLGPVAWKSFRDIVIQIGTKHCRRSKNCHGEVSQASENIDVLPTWRLICSRLATYIKQDDQLELRLICGAASKETATAFLDPLQTLPCLRGLSIRMGPHRNLDLQHMIMATIQQKTRFFPLQPTGSSPFLRNGSFPFLDLPVELQIRILEYSSLIAPEALISQLPYKQFIPIDCWAFNCTALPDYYIVCNGSYCPSTHTAFSNLYPCWIIQHGLFLVSKAIRQLALSVYYLKNTFEINCGSWNSPVEAEVEAKDIWTPSTSAFLRQLPEYSWKYLRHIHFKFPPMPDDAFHSNSKETFDWINTLNSLSQAIPPFSLTLEVGFGPRGCSGHYLPYSPNKAMKMSMLFYRIVEPIVSHRGVFQDFFIHIYGLVHWSATMDIEFNLEQLLEWRVMGGGYDSVSRGKNLMEPFSHEVLNG